MIGIRKLGRLGMQALTALFVVATISCGGPGSAGTVDQEFSTSDQFFAGRFSGETRFGDFQTVQFTFTGSNNDTIDNGEVIVANDDDIPDGVILPLESGSYEMDGGTFDSTNGAFTLFGRVDTAADDDNNIPSFQIPVSITGQAGGPFTDRTPGTFTMDLNGTILTGELFRGTIDDNFGD